MKKGLTHIHSTLNPQSHMSHVAKDLMCNNTPRNTGWKNQVSIVTLTTVTSKHFSWESSFVYSLDITNKGIKTPYRKIQNHLTLVC